MQRLAIVDVAHGQQPYCNEDGTVVVVFNGEVYNHHELRREVEARGHHLASHADGEVIAHLYEDDGADFVGKLRGMFALALVDTKRNRLVLARDAFGKKPLFFTRRRDGHVAFASELDALCRVVETPEIDPQAVYDYLSFGVVPQPRTIYRGVEAVPRGSVVTCDTDAATTSRWWHPGSPEGIGFADAVHRTRELVADATRARLESERPLGVFLSAGVDSSVVAYEAAQAIGPSLQTFTASTGGSADESSVARRTAKALGVKNHVLPIDVVPPDDLAALVRSYGQPFADSSAIPSMKLARLAGEHVTVVLNGDGGDEVFAGYRRYLAARSARWVDRVPEPVAKSLGSAIASLAPDRRTPLGYLQRLLAGAGVDWPTRYFKWTTDMLLEHDKRSVWNGPEGMVPTELLVAGLSAPGDPLARLLSTDQAVILVSDLLVKMDIATMANSIEGRSPLLDQRLAEFAATVPLGHLLHRGQPKALLRQAYRDVLPAEVIGGAKKGFEVPMATWLRTDLRPLIHDVLLSPDARTADWLDRAAIAEAVCGARWAEKNWAYVVYSLLILELWLRDHAG